MINTIIDAVVNGTIYFALLVIIVYGGKYLYDFFTKRNAE